MREEVNVCVMYHKHSWNVIIDQLNEVAYNAQYDSWVGYSNFYKHNHF